jgi:hypothetical protein
MPQTMETAVGYGSFVSTYETAQSFTLLKNFIIFGTYSEECFLVLFSV